MDDRYKSMKKADLIHALERNEEEQKKVRHALAGLYSAMSPQYEMQKIDNEGLGTFTPVLRKIVNYNGYGNNYDLDPDNELILGVRDAFNEAENVLRYHADGYSEGINVSMRDYYDADEKMVKKYRSYFMQHKGWYLKSTQCVDPTHCNSNYHVERKKVQYSSFYTQRYNSAGYGFIEVLPDKSGNTLPDDYVWDREYRKWVSPDGQTIWDGVGKGNDVLDRDIEIVGSYR